MWIPADGSAAASTLYPAPVGKRITGFTLANGDRQLILVVRDTSLTSLTDIFTVDLNGDRVMKPLVASSFADASPSVSPDGRLLAYTSTVTGRPEVYVRPMATAAGMIRLTNHGGNNPRWLARGSRLVYGDGGRRLTADV